jgi:hypothetical protein
MIDKADKSQLGSRPRVTGGQSAGISHSRHTLQRVGHQQADRAAYAPSDKQDRVPRRKPGPVNKEA